MQGEIYDKKMYVNLDMRNNELKNLVVDKVSTLPTGTQTDGRMVYLTTADSTHSVGMYFYKDGWQLVGTGGDVSALETRVEGLETTVGDEDSGLVKDVADLQTTVGDSTSGLVKDVADIQGAYATKISTGAGTGTKVTVNSEGIVTATTDAGISDITGLQPALDAKLDDTQLVTAFSSPTDTQIPSAKLVNDAITSAITGAYKVKGSKTVAGINTLTSKVQGDVYNITDSGTITDGPTVIAGDNIVWDGSAWDKLAGTMDTSNFVTLTGAQTVDGKTFTNVDSINGMQVGDVLQKDVDTSSLNTTDDTTVPSSKLVSSQLAGKMAKLQDANATGGELVITVAGDDDSVSYMSADVGASNKPIFIDNGKPTAISGSIGTATQPVYINQSGEITAGTEIGTAGYLASDTGVIDGTSTDSEVPTSKAVYTALTTGVVTKVGTADVGSATAPIYLEDGVPTAVTSIQKSLLPNNLGYLYSATLTGDGTTTSWTLPISGSGDSYTNPSSVSVRDSDGYEIITGVQFTGTSVIIGFNTAPTNSESFTVRVIA